MRSCHREQPFLQFNGNVFAELGRRLLDALFADVSPHRRREITSAVAHYIAGVLEEGPMVSIVEGMAQRFAFQVGDAVRSLRGTFQGTVVAIEGDVVQLKTASGSIVRSAANSLIKASESPPR